MDESKIKLWDLVAKYLVIIVGAIWTLMVGTEFIDKKKAEYEFQALRLGAQGVYPRGDTQLIPDGYNIASKDDPAVCQISGQYVITNIGNYLTEIESVKFELYEIERKSGIDVAKTGEPVSYSLTPTLNKLKPVLVDEFPVNELISNGNRLERSYGFLVKVKDGHNYAVLASAQGGIVGADKIPEVVSKFRVNDLTHISGSDGYCQFADNKSMQSALKRDASDG